MGVLLRGVHPILATLEQVTLAQAVQPLVAVVVAVAVALVVRVQRVPMSIALALQALAVTAPKVVKVVKVVKAVKVPCQAAALPGHKTTLMLDGQVVVLWHVTRKNRTKKRA